MSILKVDHLSHPPAKADVDLALEGIQRRFQSVLSIACAVILVAVIGIVVIDIEKLLAQDQAFGAGVIAGFIVFGMVLWISIEKSKLSPFEPANKATCMELESLTHRPDVDRYLNLVRQQGRMLTMGEAASILRAVGYSRAKEQEDRLQEAYRRIHSLSN